MALTTNIGSMAAGAALSQAMKHVNPHLEANGWDVNHFMGLVLTHFEGVTQPSGLIPTTPIRGLVTAQEIGANTAPQTNTGQGHTLTT